MIFLLFKKRTIPIKRLSKMKTSTALSNNKSHINRFAICTHVRLEMSDKMSLKNSSWIWHLLKWNKRIIVKCGRNRKSNFMLSDGTRSPFTKWQKRNILFYPFVFGNIRNFCKHCKSQLFYQMWNNSKGAHLGAQLWWLKSR